MQVTDGLIPRTIPASKPRQHGLQPPSGGRIKPVAKAMGRQWKKTEAPEGRQTAADTGSSGGTESDGAASMLLPCYFVIAKDTTAPANELFMMKNEFGTGVTLPLLGSTV